MVIPANKVSAEDRAKMDEVDALTGTEEPTQENMATDDQQMLAEASNSQMDLGNEGRGQE